jgi:predicted kinase
VETKNKMAKLIIMRGLPASGKTTRAKEIMDKDGNVVRVNKDSLRKMLHFDKWSGSKESITRSVSRKIAMQCLLDGQNVIIDDTNLNEKTFQSWKDLAREMSAKVEVIEMNTTIEECIERDKKRKERVGESVIIGMAMQNGLYTKPKKGIVICDIDGTLADIGDRRKFVEQEPKDWKKFYGSMNRDKLRKKVLDKVLKLEEKGYEIFLVSGRPENHREVTEMWLEIKCKGYIFHKALFMRPEDDHRPDTEIKKEIYDRYFKNYQVYKVFDDRPSVIRMWKEQGLDVIDVGDGIEF